VWRPVTVRPGSPMRIVVSASSPLTYKLAGASGEVDEGGHTSHVRQATAGR